MNAQQPLFGEEPERKPRAQRAPDPLFDALAFVCSIKPAELTVSGRGQLNRALKEIRDTGATPGEILRRSRAYRERFNHTPTPGALARHWAGLATRAQAVREVTQQVPVEGDYIEREELVRRAQAYAREKGMPWTRT